jgi:hypothetical protein
MLVFGVMRSAPLARGFELSIWWVERGWTAVVFMETG